MTDSTTTRRRFLVATIAFSGLTAGVIGPAALRFGTAWAQAGGASSQGRLARLARLMLPHDGLPENVYADVMNNALVATVDDTAAIGALLDEQQSEKFVDGDEAAQLRAMRAVQSEAAFAAVLSALKTHLYDDPRVWAVINYEGPSYQNGGYLNRGAGDIDWLPEDE